MPNLDIQEFLNRPDVCLYCDLFDYEADCTCDSHLWEDDGREYEEMFVDMYGEAHEYSDEEYSKSNRQKAKTPKTSKAWCDHCDANYAGADEKCIQCGQIVGGTKRHRRIKKETNAR